MGKHFDLEYKIQIAQMVVEDGKKATQLARDLDIPVGTIRNWVDAYKKKSQKGFVGSGNTSPEIKPYKDLQKENTDLKQEVEIL
ncbi:transposase, partial [Bacillus sp. J33]|uniref:transposase n=6 Tax=Bacillus sp. J33 TaxID=935836 RepID=UPI00047D76F9